MSDTFITLKAADPFTADPTAYNEMYIRPNAIMHFEPYSGPFSLQAWGPNGALQHTGSFKQILCGTLVMLYGGGCRIYLDSPSDVMSKIKNSDIISNL